MPVLETKKLLETKVVDEIQVVVDNDTSRENVTRFLESQGYLVSLEKREDEFCLTARRKSAPGTDKEAESGKIVVVIDGETMGRGNDQLGMVLLRSFLNTLKELNPLPWRLIFLNTGVKLASEGSEYLPLLQEIAGLGVEIICCGTCLDFFQLKERLRVGRVTNMYEIVSSIIEASRMLKP